MLEQQILNKLIAIVYYLFYIMGENSIQTQIYLYAQITFIDFAKSCDFGF